MLAANHDAQQNWSITQATPADQLDIDRFLSENHTAHRHLDWLNPLDWIGEKPFLLEKNVHKIQAILLTAPEVPEATWVRLFSTKQNASIETTWQQMLSAALPILKHQGIKQLAGLGLSEWFQKLLIGSDFSLSNGIVVLERIERIPIPELSQPGIVIRPMQTEHLPQVFAIDQLAFVPLWQNSLAGLSKAFQQQGICTVAVKSDAIVGFQISTVFGGHGHLARLAVHPQHQGQQIASLLTADLLIQCSKEQIWQMTVNTQADNLSSLTLYQKFGFYLTGERIPVFLREL